MVSGVYEIVHLASGRRYIGSSENIRKRWQEHRRGLARRDHRNSKLQRAWNKYGEAAFEFSVLVVCAPDRSTILRHEQMWLDEFRPAMNVCFEATSPLGVKHPKGARTGKTPRTPEWREKTAAALRGRKLPPEHVKNAADAMRGRKHPRTPEWTENLRVALENRSHKKKAAHRNALKEAWVRRRARGNPLSLEAREKLRAAANRRWDKHRAAQAAANS